MCGRYASFRTEQDLADEFAIATVADDARLLPPSWNVAPTDGVRLVVERADASTGQVVRQLRLARWGLVPSWARDPSIGSRLINARVESVATTSAFARPFAARRALLPADGWFEWQERPAEPGRRRPAKQPYYLHPEDGSILALAGLYEFWTDPTKAQDDPSRWLVTATVLTRPSAGPLVAIHDRQPVVLPRATWDAWLSPGVGPDEARGLLDVEPPPVVARPVSTEVNAVAHDGPRLLDPVGAPDEPPDGPSAGDDLSPV